MQLVPVLPGLRLPRLTIAVPLALSVSLTVPAVHELPAFEVVPENAAYDDCQTTPALARIPSGRTPLARFLRTRLDGPRIVTSLSSSRYDALRPVPSVLTPQTSERCPTD